MLDPRQIVITRANANDWYKVIWTFRHSLLSLYFMNFKIPSDRHKMRLTDLTRLKHLAFESSSSLTCNDLFFLIQKHKMISIALNSYELITRIPAESRHYLFNLRSPSLVNIPIKMSFFETFLKKKWSPHLKELFITNSHLDFLADRPPGFSFKEASPTLEALDLSGCLLGQQTTHDIFLYNNYG